MLEEKRQDQKPNLSRVLQEMCVKSKENLKVELET